MNTRSTSTNGAYFGFHWNTDVAERKEVNDKADSLIDAAVKGGMKKEDAVRIAEHIFSAGWSAGSDDEAYNSSEN